jgi:hypothetical protein
MAARLAKWPAADYIAVREVLTGKAWCCKLLMYERVALAKEDLRGRDDGR